VGLLVGDVLREIPPQAQPCQEGALRGFLRVGLTNDAAYLRDDVFAPFRNP
jgi:hypothetical protein